MSHVIEGLAVKLQELPPRGDFTGPAQLVTLVDDDAGEVFALMATDEAAATLAGRELPCRVRAELRVSAQDLAYLTNGTRRGKAYRLRVVRLTLTEEGGKR